MTWFAFKGLNGGKAVDLAGTQEKQAVVEGFHGYATEAQAEAAPNSVNLVTRVLADGWIADYNAAVKEQAQPGGKNDITTPGGVAGAVVDSSPLGSWQQSLTNFLGALTNGNTWIRLAEGVLGVVLIAIGLARITHAVPIATKIAGAVA